MFLGNKCTLNSQILLKKYSENHQYAILFLPYLVLLPLCLHFDDVLGPVSLPLSSNVYCSREVGLLLCGVVHLSQILERQLLARLLMSGIPIVHHAADDGDVAAGVIDELD